MGNLPKVAQESWNLNPCRAYILEYILSPITEILGNICYCSSVTLSKLGFLNLEILCLFRIPYRLVNRIKNSTHKAPSPWPKATIY